MKKLLFLILSSIAFYGTTHAQFAFKGQWDISAAGGWIASRGFNITVGGEKALGDLYNSLHVKFNFMQNQARVNHSQMDHFNDQTYQLFADYTYSLAKFIPHPWYIQGSAGLNFGYENIPDSPIPSLIITNSSRFVYGLNVALQVELSAARNFAIFLEPRFIYNFNSDIRKGFFVSAIGFKYYL